ncbi:MAG TPA: sigma-70 family RNA polymerase sigma factor [Polyangiaceae bacterium]
MNSDSAAAYVVAMRGMPILDREQELELLRQRANGDQRAVDALARAHQRTVVSLAFRYRGYGVPIGDLVGEGNVGLMRAMEKFDPERGVRFGTYAGFWIRAYMLDYVIRTRNMVSGGGAMRTRTFFKLRREWARMSNLLGTGEAAEEALAVRLGVSVAKLRAMLQRLESRDVSLDSPIAETGASPLDRLVAEVNQERELLQRQLDLRFERAFGEALSALDAREQYIVQHRLVETDVEVPSLAEIGRRFGISRERARQLETCALQKLRRVLQNAHGTLIREWLDRGLSDHRGRTASAA